MIHEGQVVLFEFPQINQEGTKLRPALVVRKAPGPYDDWLICMISSQISQCIADFDEVIDESDPDFESSGLKNSSVVRISRLAVVSKSMLLGAVGEIALGRLEHIHAKLSGWIKST